MLHQVLVFTNHTCSDGVHKMNKNFFKASKGLNHTYGTDKLKILLGICDPRLCRLLNLSVYEEGFQESHIRICILDPTINHWLTIPLDGAQKCIL